MTEQAAYKIIESDGESIKTLFHGFNGSRTLLKNQWLKIENPRLVKDGSSYEYEEGWHFLPTREECEEYLSRFKTRLDKLDIVECLVRNVRQKSDRSSAWLAQEIMFI
jgi:hypothetical protein